MSEQEQDRKQDREQEQAKERDCAACREDCEECNPQEERCGEDCEDCLEARQGCRHEELTRHVVFEATAVIVRVPALRCDGCGNAGVRVPTYARRLDAAWRPDVPWLGASARRQPDGSIRHDMEKGDTDLPRGWSAVTWHDGPRELCVSCTRFVRDAVAATFGWAPWPERGSEVTP